MPRAWPSKVAKCIRAPGWTSRCAAACLCLGLPLVVLSNAQTAKTSSFEISLKKNFKILPQDGRLFVVLARTNQPEPRLLLGRAGDDAPQALARDVTGFGQGACITLDQHAFGFPATNFSSLPAGDYLAQALFDSDRDRRSPSAPGNVFSGPLKIHWEPARG